MDNEGDGLTSSEDFVASIQHLPVREQNQLLKERVEYIDGLNQREMNKINEGSERPVKQTNETDIGSDIDNMDIKAFRESNKKELDEMHCNCEKKLVAAKELAEFCINHYKDEKKERLNILNARSKKAESMTEIGKARLKAMDKLYKAKVSSYKRNMHRARTENYFFYQLLCDEMYKRMGYDVGSSKIYSQHILRKKMLERKIIKHNQKLMSTEEGKSSTSSSSTAYVVEALKRDVDRLEQIVDSFCDQTKQNKSGTDLFREVEDDEMSNDGLFSSLPNAMTLERSPLDTNEEQMKQLNVDELYANAEMKQQNGSKDNVSERTKPIENVDGKTFFINDSDDEIVNGDELSLSDFSV